MTGTRTFGLVVALLAAAGHVLAQPQEAPAPTPPSPAPAASGAICAPPTLTRMTTRLVTPGLDASSPDAQPRTLYRQGSQFLRMEGIADYSRGEKRLLVVAEPNVWIMNQMDHSGRHTVDPGPTYDAKAPIVAVAGAPPSFIELEFGCELAFVTARAPTPARTLGKAPNQVNVHVVTEGEHMLAIMLDARQKEPVLISYARAGKPLLVVRYDAFAANLPERPKLFQPPPGFRFMADKR